MTLQAEAATELARLGFRVFPAHSMRDGRCTCKKDDCHSPAKHPLYRKEFFEDGCTSASNGSGRVAAFWKQWPGANIGLATGHDGLIVLDIDPRHGGDETLRDLLATHGPLPETVRVITGGSGAHVYLRGPADLKIRNNAATKLGSGLDIRGTGGYVIAPISLHESGNYYAWEHAPWDVEVAACPQWLLDLIKDTDEPAYAPPVGETISSGQRDNTLASLGGSMRRRGMTYDSILAALSAENALKCDPPLPHGDVQRIAMSVSRYPPHLTPVVMNHPVPTEGDFQTPQPDPATDVIADNHIRVNVWTDFGVVQFDCDELEEGSKRDLDTTLTVTVDGLGITKEPYTQPVNLRSHAARSNLQTALNAQFGRHEWTTLVSIAYNRLIPAFLEAQSNIAEQTEGAITASAPVFMLRPYIVHRAGSILFALPGKGKTYTALLWAVSIDAGVDKFWSVTQGRVLYVNLERDAPSMARRLGAINANLGLRRDRPLTMINRKGKSLTQLIKAIVRIVREQSIDVVFLDSISRTGGGSMVQDDVANRIADQLNGMGTTWVALGHTSWPANGVEPGQGHIFGSVMFEAAADICIALTSEEDVSTHELGIGLQITKGNDVGKTTQERFAYTFDETGLVSVRKAFDYEFSELKVNARVVMSTRNLVADYLKVNGKSDARSIAEALGKARNTVSEILQSPGFVEAGKEGKIILYGLQVSDDVSERQIQPIFNGGLGEREVSKTGVSETPFLRDRQTTHLHNDRHIDVSEDVSESEKRSDTSTHGDDECQRCNNAMTHYGARGEPLCESCFRMMYPNGLAG